MLGASKFGLLGSKPKSGGMPSGLVGHWKMNDVSGTVVKDSKGSNDGTASCDASLITNPGVINTSLRTMSAGPTPRTISIPANSYWNPANADFSLTFWMKTGAYGGPEPFARDSSYIPPWLWYCPTYLALFMSSNGTSFDMASMVACGAVSAAAFRHIVLARTGSSFKVYNNGVLVDNGGGVTFTSASAILTSLNPIIIGQGQGAYNTDVYVDDLRLYNRGLTDAEVAQIYNGGAGTEAE